MYNELEFAMCSKQARTVIGVRDTRRHPAHTAHPPRPGGAQRATGGGTPAGSRLDGLNIKIQGALAASSTVSIIARTICLYVAACFQSLQPSRRFVQTKPRHQTNDKARDTLAQLDRDAKPHANDLGAVVKLLHVPVARRIG